MATITPLSLVNARSLAELVYVSCTSTLTARGYLHPTRGCLHPARGCLHPGTHLRGVVAQPVVGLSEVVEDDAAAVAAAGRQHDGGGGVRLAGHPGGVEGVGDQEEGHDQDHPTGHLVEREGGDMKEWLTKPPSIDYVTSSGAQDDRPELQ